MNVWTNTADSRLPLLCGDELFPIHTFAEEKTT
jgi:hypothetical protein